MAITPRCSSGIPSELSARTEWTANGSPLCLLYKVGDKAKQITDIRRIEIISVRLTTLFQQMLDDASQLFTKIELGRTKTLNEK